MIWKWYSLGWLGRRQDRIRDLNKDKEQNKGARLVAPTKSIESKNSNADRNRDDSRATPSARLFLPAKFKLEF